MSTGQAQAWPFLILGTHAITILNPKPDAPCFSLDELYKGQPYGRSTPQSRQGWETNSLNRNTQVLNARVEPPTLLLTTGNTNRISFK